MRILHSILSEGFYGSERYCIELAAEQARRGHDVEVAVIGRHSDCTREMRKIEAAVGPKLRLVVIPGWAPAWSHRLFARRAIARLAPDVVHTHLTPAARRVGETGQKLGVQHVSTLLLHYNRREHDRCDGLIAVAKYQFELAPKQHRDRIKLVWCWIPKGVQDALPRVGPDEIARLRGTWDAGERDLVFGSLSRLVPEKGMDVLVKAFRAAFPHGDEPVRLVVAGDGNDRGMLSALAAGDGRIVLAGAQTDVARHLRAFDVFVSASRFEPFGIAILEALAARLPLVVTRAEGPREFMTDPRALWAEPGDVATLTEALRQAATRGRQRFDYDLSKFDVASAAAEIEGFYREIAARRGRPIA